MSKADRVLADLASYKSQQIKLGNWPSVEDLPVTCRVCGRTPAVHGIAGDAGCWEGRARMAKARRAAGLKLDDVDVEALARFPEPSSSWVAA